MQPRDAEETLLEEEVDAVWGDEVKRRLDEVDRGEVKPIPWLEARRRIFAAANGERRRNPE